MNNQWICDSCGEYILKPIDGWVEWLTRKRQDSETNIGRGLRLVHHCGAHNPLSERCQYDQDKEYKQGGSILSDSGLEEFIGADGLMSLLELLARSELPADEVIEMIKRLHIPGYEHARRHFDAALAEGVFDPSSMPGFYTQHEIQAVLEYANDA